LHIDYEQRGVAGIEILEAMLLAAQLDHAVDHELRDRDLVHPVLARLLGLCQPIPRQAMAGYGGSLQLPRSGLESYPWDETARLWRQGDCRPVRGRRAAGLDAFGGEVLLFFGPLPFL
jgi:hypothetical protein